ncbi:beta-glucosidase BglX [Flavobacterium sp. IMCC34852]|uniref:Periplasmic beta-glucosidase n=1 Tax=Flavobacterium rivulicola TaxID=2732161 RepID=A0A7Y3RAB9_9FLAO|nr:beta-glucosidase BglX [Flavobacterium sp. IMCC34852]NNT72834.1 beta-glucosidase BglX [Flavobacterium sp. IMCC34852]
MKIKVTIIILLITSLTFAQKTKKGKPATIAPKEIFIPELLAKMTLEEKIGQLNLPTSGDITTGQANSSNIAKKIEEGKVGGLFNIKSVQKIKEVQKIAVEKSRLKIPLIFGMDVIHGYETVFPIPLGLSCSWDMPLIQQTARIAANEATADGINWTFSPMVDLSRDPRWGRVSEGSGEDTFLGSEIAKAMVNGYQNNNLKANNSMLACVKHFALYGAPEGGRDYNTVDMSHIRMYNEYFPPYKAAIDAGVGSVMASFNEVDGIPATGNKWLMTDVLRNQWKFGGFVVTDYTGISEMTDHGMGDLQNSSSLALKAGIDMDMVSEGFLSTLKKSYEEGKISMTDIDKAVTRILEAKYDLGLFENPYKNCDIELAKKVIFSKESRDFARKVAAESMVLLKNDNNILPLKKSGTIALFGPLFDNKANMPGTWSVAANFDKPITILEGLKSTVGNSVNILSARGCNFLSTAAEEKININPHNPKSYVRDNRTDEELIAEALEVAKKSDVLVAVLGEGAEMSGECSSRTSIELPIVQKRLLNELLKTGKPVVLVLFTGRPLVLVEESQKVSTILNVWFPGSEAGLAISDVLFGDVNPSGKLTATWPRNVGQIPIYYNHKNTGRPLANTEGKFEKFRSNYLDVRNEPLYPFGFGLSYTSFAYSNLTASSSQIKANEKLIVSVDVTNTGNFDGKEVVQLYIRDLVGSVTRPVKELKGFKKIFLKKGEKQTVVFELSIEDLKFYNADLKHAAEAGEFEVFVGTNSDTTDKIKFNLVD